MDQSQLPSNKKQAIEEGSNKFYDGTKCIHGHDSPKYVKGGCVECAKIRARKSASKQKEKRKQATKDKLRRIVRICKNRMCRKQFSPRIKSNQVFCSQRCADLQGRRDYKQRNKAEIRKKENARKRKKYQQDSNYKEKQVQRSKRNYEKLNMEERQTKGKLERSRRDPERHREYMRNYFSERSKTDINFRVLSNLRSRVYSAVKNNGGEKSIKTTELIGCSINELRRHLESLFSEGMTWDNYGEWHIDHIVPCAYFKNIGTSPEEQKACFHFSNLQPLWGADNLSKGCRLPSDLKEAS